MGSSYSFYILLSVIVITVETIAADIGRVTFKYVLCIKSDHSNEHHWNMTKN